MNFLSKVEALRFELVYPKQLVRLITVQFDDRSIRLHTSARLCQNWNQRFIWSDVTDACYVHGDGDHADVLFIDLRDHDVPARVPMQSLGSEELYSQLIARGIYPIAARRTKSPSVRSCVETHCPSPEQYEGVPKVPRTAPATESLMTH